MSQIDRLRKGVQRYDNGEDGADGPVDIDGTERVMNEAADLLEDMQKEIKRKYWDSAICRGLGNFLEKRLKDES